MNLRSILEEGQKKKVSRPPSNRVTGTVLSKKADHVCIGIWGRTNMYFARAYILVGQAVTAVVGNTLGGLFPYLFKQSMPSGRLLLSDCPQEATIAGR